VSTKVILVGPRTIQGHSTSPCLHSSPPQNFHNRPENTKHPRPLQTQQSQHSLEPVIFYEFQSTPSTKYATVEWVKALTTARKHISSFFLRCHIKPREIYYYPISPYASRFPPPRVLCARILLLPSNISDGKKGKCQRKRTRQHIKIQHQNSTKELGLIVK
jgi:hypothetical protein